MGEFSNLYNNLHFPNFKNVPPCIVIPLKHCEIIRKREEILKYDAVSDDWKDDKREESFFLDTNSDKNGHESVIDKERIEYDSKNVLSYQVELPVCTVCLRRLQCTTSGVDGGNDIPVSMWFSGNADRCQVCKVYGEISESDGSQSQSQSHTQTRTGSGSGSGSETGVRAGIRTGSGTGNGTISSIDSTGTMKLSQVNQLYLYHFLCLTILTN